MKTNKKAILGMLVAIVISLGVMGGINENKCDYFKPFCTSHFASGIDHLLDNISYSIAVAIRRELYTLMGRNMYYRIRNKERLLHPCEQEQIAAIFLKHGIKTKPEFDQYIDKYDW